MKQLFLGFFVLGTLSAFCQNGPGDCSAIRNGVFYSYPKNTTDQYRIEWQGNIETDIDLKNGDSSVWKVHWEKDCKFTEEYGSGNILTTEQVKFFKKHQIGFLVLDITDNYYTFSCFLDKTNGAVIATDTVWAHPKTTFSNSITYARIAKDGVDSLSISDTSKYALVYIYRPQKITGCAIDCMVELNGKFACNSMDPFIYVYRFFKEGPLEISSTMFKQKRREVLHLEVKFGNKYYIRSLPVVSLATTRGWKAALYNKDPFTAQQEIKKIHRGGSFV